MKTTMEEARAGNHREEQKPELRIQKEKTSLLVTILSFFLIPLLLILSLPVYLKYLSD